MPAYRFYVSGIAPADVRRRPAHERVLFWRLATRWALVRKDWELSMGYNARGKRMPPVLPETRLRRRSAMGKADPYAPYLTPAGKASRTRALLTGWAEKDRAVLTWKWDSVSRDEWSQTLEYHRRRGWQYDVIGLSPKGVAWVKAKASDEWRAMIGGAATLPMTTTSVGASGVLLQQSTPRPTLPARARSSPLAALLRILLTALLLGLALEALRELLGDDFDAVLAEAEKLGLVSLTRDDDGVVLAVAA